MSVTLTRNQALTMLKKLGAVVQSGGEHLLVRLKVNDKHIFNIPISNGSKDIPTGTAHRIFRLVHLKNNEQCIGLRDCPMKKEEYIDILRRQGIL